MRALIFLWVAPVTLPAAVLVVLARCTDSVLQLRDGVLEAAGGRLGWLLRVIYPPMSIAAITLGHVVLAQSLADLDATRAHERVHVRQYELWGPCFPLLYLAASVAAVARGGDAYLDNRFERKANCYSPFTAHS
jgi:hypothetical protein